MTEDNSKTQKDNVPLGRSWDELAEFGPLAAVIDPRDKLGLKNTFIDQLHKHALKEEINDPIDVLLDFGCGSGRMYPLTTTKAGYTVGIDSAFQLMKLFNHVQNRPFSAVQYDGSRFPFKNEVFCSVLSVWTIQYLLENKFFEHTIREMVRCLKPGGSMYLLEQVGISSGSWQRKKDEYISLISQAGCKILHCYPIRAYPR